MNTENWPDIFAFLTTVHVETLLVSRLKLFAHDLCLDNSVSFDSVILSVMPPHGVQQLGNPYLNLQLMKICHLEHQP